MKLLKYDEISQEQYLEYISDWEATGERIIPGSSARMSDDFEKQLQFWRMHDSDKIREKNLVPGTLYFLENNSGKLLGSISFRHELTEELKIYGGHVGYGVRPSERRKGNSTSMLSLALDAIRIRGYSEITVTCDTQNTGSKRTIENNNGRLKSRYLRNGIEICIYSIKL